MKASIRFFVIMFVLNIQFLPAQIPNGSFEQWANGNPVSWFTPNIPGFAVPITQSNTAHDGSSAVRGEIVTYLSEPWPAYVYSGDLGLGFPVTERHQTIKGWYQFNPIEADIFFVYSILYANQNPIAVAEFMVNTQAASYTQFSADYQYYSNDVPNTCIIYIGIAGGGTDSLNFHVGSNFLVDHVELSGSVPTSVGDGNTVYEFKLSQNYPNPFNPSTKISYSVPQQSNVTLKIYDALGTEVRTLVNEDKPAGNYEIDFNASGLASGMYFYTIKAGAFVETKKMILLR